jgi:archaellum component FlaF (FlaF/FlaG flagellin family)
MNTLFGLYRPDEGTILVDGQEVHFHDPVMPWMPGSAWSTSTSCWSPSSRSPRT